MTVKTLHKTPYRISGKKSTPSRQSLLKILLEEPEKVDFKEKLTFAVEACQSVLESGKIDHAAERYNLDKKELQRLIVFELERIVPKLKKSKTLNAANVKVSLAVNGILYNETFREGIRCRKKNNFCT